MSTRQKTARNESASKHGGGLRTIFDMFRTPKQPERSHDRSKREPAAAQEVPPVKSRGPRPRKHEAGGGTSSTVASEPAGAADDASTPNFLSKLLRRQTKSKKPADRPRVGQGRDASAREQRVRGRNETGPRAEQPPQRAGESAASHSQRYGYSRIDARINAAEDKRRSQVYRPSHAGPDLARVPMSRSLKDRYSTLADDEDARRMSQMLAQLTPPAEVDRSSQFSFSDEYYRDEQRRLTIATLEGISNVDTDSSFGNEAGAGMDNTLQPPPTPTRRQRNRHSYVVAADHRQIEEEPEDSSDYHHFMQRALARDHKEHDDMWRAITDRPGKKPINPVHPDLMTPGTLERTGTFGRSKRESRRESRRERPSSKKGDESWKRASHYSYQSQDDRKRRSHLGGDLNTSLAFDSSQQTPRRTPSTSVTKRMSDYIRPPRNGTPDNKRLSRASFM
ncbi:hypothetical protein AB5N19_04010 [Seiridium cardinale]